MAILHKSRNLEALVPKYVKDFHCIGPDCPDNCCTGWTVSIDRKTYNAYQKVAHPDLATRFQSAVQRTRKTGGDANYAKVEMKEATGECPFMEQRICSIQRELGEDKLSNTCFSYPRSTHEVGGVRQQALTLSCPEAARLALADRLAMDFTTHTISIRDGQALAVGRKFGLEPDLMNRVRFFSIQLMRGEGMALWERLATLGVMCETVGSLIQKGNQARIDSVLEELSVAISSGAVRQSLAHMNADHDVQALIFAKVWGDRMGRSRASSNQIRVQEDILCGLGFDPETGLGNKQALVKLYADGLLHLNATLRQHPALIENYLVNEIFREQFPFGDSSPLNQYTQLVVRYGVIRLMLVGRCLAIGGPLDLRAAIDTIQVFARIYQHNARFVLDLQTALRAANWDSLEKIYRFLRDDQ